MYQTENLRHCDGNGKVAARGCGVVGVGSREVLFEIPKRDLKKA